MVERMLRRGLPRVPGGAPWPPAGTVAEVEATGPGGTEPVEDGAAVGLDAPSKRPASADVAAAPVVGFGSQGDVAPQGDTALGDASPRSDAAPQGGEVLGNAARVAAASAASSPGSPVVLRRGLPRTPGGEPWPPAGAVGRSAAAPAVATVREADRSDAGSVGAHARESGVPVSEAVAQEPVPAASGTVTATDAAPAASGPVGKPTSGIRRGLPRTPGGEPWPPVGTVAAVSAPPSPGSGPDAAPVAVQNAEDSAITAAVTAPASDRSATAARTAAPPATAAPDAARLAPAKPAAAGPAADPAATDRAAASVVVAEPAGAPLPWKRTVWNGSAPRHTAAPASDTRRPAWTQAIAALLGAAALGILAGAAIAFVRALLSLPFMQDFLVAFPGEYQPAIAVEPGFAPWVGWQHFFNAFLIVLIIRSGLRIRTEKRPTVFWTPRGSAKGKISLTLWFHQALDILWLVNGAIFVILLFTTGHWVRIVPTSWEVLPNALSAALQYISFDWPHENGWNNYNSLQQLAYFATVFIAGPLAAITGFRMSGMWPKRAEKLSKAYPVEWARALHFPVMLYFVAFIIAHVALVMLTGFLRNLNHMYASQDAVTWTGFWVFVASLAVMAGGWFAARPLVLAPIARLFGSVSGR